MNINTYVEYCLKNESIVRWSDSSMPLNFYIAPFRWYKAKNDSYSYIQLVYDALKAWEVASDGKIKFNIVNNINDSQINLDWKRVDRNSLGHCYFNYDNIGRLYSAEIQIGLSDGYLHQQYQNKSEVYHTILHEIGHSLGLGHSPYQNDIMYVPHQYGTTTLSEIDKNTIRWLYYFNHGVLKSEVISQYGLSSDYNFDQLILKIDQNEAKTTNFKEILTSLDTDPKRNLTDEQNILAQINKYNQLSQSVKLPANIKKYIDKTISHKTKEDR